MDGGAGVRGGDVEASPGGVETLGQPAEGVTCEECLNVRTPDPYKAATLAVMHLHRPSEFHGIDGPTPWCNECDCAYPCPTTETIHRTLNGEKNA